MNCPKCASKNVKFMPDSIDDPISDIDIYFCNTCRNLWGIEFDESDYE